MLAAGFTYKQRRNYKMRKQKRKKNEKTKVVQKKWRNQRKAGKVQRVVEGGGVEVGTSERPGRCQPSPLRKKNNVCLYPLPRGQRHRFCVGACAQTTAIAPAPDYNSSSSSSSSIASRRWSRVLAPQPVNPALAVGRTCNVPSKLKFRQQQQCSTAVPLCTEM